MADQQLVDMVPAIGAKINDSIRHSKGESTIVGWGQFLQKSEHEHQIGLYGTCAALLVRAVIDPKADCPNGVIEFLKSRKERTKDYNQNSRLAYLVWSLSFSVYGPLTAIRDEWLNELVNRQQQDGGWGDTQRIGEEVVTSRPEVTAFCVFAMVAANSNQSVAIKNAVSFLNRFILSRVTPTEQVDPFVIAAVLAGSTDRKLVPLRVIETALSMICREHMTSSDVRIFFFDYFDKDDDDITTKRDFFCVPEFFAHCSISCSRILADTYSLAAQFTVQRARSRLKEALERELEDGTVTPPTSSHVATVDQGFAAVSAKLLQAFPPQMEGFVRLISKLVASIKRPSLVKALLSLLLAGLLGVLAQNPTLISDQLKDMQSPYMKAANSFIADRAASLQIVGIVVGLLLGQSLVINVLSYLRSIPRKIFGRAA